MKVKRGRSASVRVKAVGWFPQIDHPIDRDRPKWLNKSAGKILNILVLTIVTLLFIRISRGISPKFQLKIFYFRFTIIQDPGDYLWGNEGLIHRLGSIQYVIIDLFSAPMWNRSAIYRVGGCHSWPWRLAFVVQIDPDSPVQQILSDKDQKKENSKVKFYYKSISYTLVRNRDFKNLKAWQLLAIKNFKPFENVFNSQ